MKSSAVGKSTSRRPKNGGVEILSVSPHGMWLLIHGKEYLISFQANPWFRSARIDDLFSVELLHDKHLHWPALDVDLHLDSLEFPERFPLVSKILEKK
jgi:hypothetical protein